jgi:hypothetical protein
VGGLLMIGPEAHAIIDRAAERLEGRAEYYKRSVDYFEGRHPTPPATDRWTKQLQDAFENLRDNLMPLVIEALVSRLKVSGFAPQLRSTDPDELPAFTYPAGQPELIPQPGRWVSDRDRPQDRQAEASRLRAEDLWEHNRMDAGQRQVHEEAGKKGDAYVIVWADEHGRAGIYPNDAELCCVEWDAEMPRRKLWAVKRWRDTNLDRVRVDIYYRDRVEKYVSVREAEHVKAKTDPSEWESFRPADLVDVLGEDEEPTGRTELRPREPWPLPNLYGEVPVFHFVNRGKWNAYGRSELEEVAPIQDALNKEFQSLLLTSEQYGIPWRYIAGLRPEFDQDTGKEKPINFKPLVDNILAVWGEGVSLGQFAAAELVQHVGVINDLRAEIGRLSQTPPHMLFLFTGDIPSGEALKVVETPFTAKVEDRQVFWGNTWEDVMAFAVLVDVDARVRYSVEWEDTQPKSMLEIAQTGEAWIRLGVPRRYVWKRLLNMTDAECNEMEALRREEQAAEPLPPVGAPNGQGTMPGQPGEPPQGVTPPQLAPYAQRTRDMVGQQQTPPRRRQRRRQP